MSVAVVIPTLNEEAELPATLARIGEAEVIVSDGGSTDRTATIARERGAQVVTAGGGRGVQLNAGARAARADTLLFLHADTHLPPDWQAEIARILSAPGPIVGAFSLAIRNARLAERIVASGANIRSRVRGLPYGDQALFMRRSTFAALGGFRALPIMEDYDFLKRARRIARIAISPLTVTTSNRRWRRRGVLGTLAINQAMIAGWRLGIAPDRLARFYRGS